MPERARFPPLQRYWATECHHLERRIDDTAGLLRVEVLDQFHRALNIGEQCGDGLAFPIDIFSDGDFDYLDWCII
jgi:hypothetical protein